MKKTQFNACNPFNLKLLYTHTRCIDNQFENNLRKGNAMNTSPIARLQALRTSVTNKSVSSTAISNVVQLPYLSKAIQVKEKVARVRAGIIY